MKALEQKAEKYDKGIKILTLGRLPEIKKHIANNYVNNDETLLDIGMGTGSFAVLCAKNGVKVTGIDISEKMINVAKKNIISKSMNALIQIIKMPVIELDEKFSNNSFDKITAILLLSELYYNEQEYCLDQIYRILKEKGEFILVDEVKPIELLKRIPYYLIRIPLVIITYLKSLQTTKYLKNIEKRLENHNFSIIEQKSYLLDSLKLIRSQKN
jgi:ubiquinone/menaquinone biosynthesis C-methylase UbiE